MVKRSYRVRPLMVTTEHVVGYLIEGNTLKDLAIMVANRLTNEERTEIDGHILSRCEEDEIHGGTLIYFESIFKDGAA